MSLNFCKLRLSTLINRRFLKLFIMFCPEAHIFWNYLANCL